MSIGYHEIPTIHADTADDAVQDGALLDLAPRGEVKPLSEIASLDDYLRSYGKILGKKAIHALNPLHVPNRDMLPEFEDMLREPFPAQQHVIAASVKMMDKVGSGFIVGEMGTGKTLLRYDICSQARESWPASGRQGRQVPGVDPLPGSPHREVGPRA